MRLLDALRLVGSALWAQRLRAFLTALGIAVGIAAVVLLTAIGEGIHQYVRNEFSQFGTNVIEVTPGRVTTHGGSVGMFGTERPLSIEDAEALRRVRDVAATSPAVRGNAEVETHSHSRWANIFGVGAALPQVMRFQVASGRFLPDDDPRAPRAFVVLGSKVRSELFGEDNPLGERVRIGGERYRVIGVMEPKGQFLDMDMDDAVYIPAAKALEMFNREGLMSIHVAYAPEAPAQEIESGIKKLLTARHGREDFTVTTQQEMLDTLSAVLDVLTFAVGALGGISLVVGAVGILTIMTIAVSERTGEIGLLRALGAERGQVQLLFLGEATVLAATGGLAGLLLGAGGAQLLHLALPALPVQTTWTYAALAEALAALIGLSAGVLPARRAARLDPVEALRAE